jgi:hypothetical protein
MQRSMRTAVGWALAVSALLASAAFAANYSLWVNGRGGGGVAGNYENFNAWGPATVNAGVNKKAVNWDGRSRIADQNFLLRNALDCYCTGPNWCYVAAYSAGDLMIGYALSLYGGTTRYKKDAAPNAAGECGNSDGTTQVGWNIKWVDVAAGAGGGSEVADMGQWATPEPLVADLKTTTARAMYDHNSTRSKWFYMYAGAKGAVHSFLLPGQDDEAVAYHSSGGVSGSSGGSYCNPSDWLCNDLTLGTAVNEGGRAKWSFHSVAFRDSGEQYSHRAGGNWGGVVSLVRADMETNAR